MKVQSDDRFFNNQSQGNMIQKIISQFKAGDKFNAVICDIKPDMVSLKLSDDSILNAKSLIIPEARIGQNATFVVKENSSGQILIEMVKENQSNINFNFAKELLLNADLPVTKENVELINSLLSNNINADKDILQKAAFFKYSDIDMTTDKILFLLKENFPAQKVSAKVLENILNSKNDFKNNLINIAEEIAVLSDGKLKDEILQLFGINKNDILDKNQLYKKIIDNLFVKINNKEDLNELNKQFENLHNISKFAEKILSEASESKNSLKNSFENVKETIEFMNNINNYKEYLQIPFNLNNKENQCEFYIFKNSKNEKKFKHNASILISLDATFIGRVETFINKEDNNLTFQFKAEKDNTLKMIRISVNKLLNVLKERKYSILSVDFKKIERPFNILEEIHKENTQIKNTNKRYSFDMRV